jgi:hypothetical protein
MDMPSRRRPSPAPAPPPILAALLIPITLRIPAAPAQAQTLPPQPGDDRTNDGPFFQLVCTPGQRHADNLFNWPRGRSQTHEHQFFGSVAVRFGVTESAARAAATTCNDTRDTAAYWVPTLYDSAGRLHTPHRLRVYYYRHADDPSALRAFPPGLQMTAGDPFATAPQPLGVVDWLCRKKRDQSAGYPLHASNPPTCRPDEYLSVSIRFPDCWNGRDLTSYDNRRHVAYSDADGRCPAGFPVKAPKMRYSITYDADGGFGGGPFTPGGLRGQRDTPGVHGMHGHFWNTWNQERLERRVRECPVFGRTVGVTACQR